MTNPQEQLSDTAAPKPYLTPTGSLIIPCNTEAKYRYWQGGQTVLKTLKEIGAPPEVIQHYERKEESR